jgi:putative FmdB family regulatory protein
LFFQADFDKFAFRSDNYPSPEQMPTYTYRCKSCSYEFEEFQSISADALRLCPSCHQESLVRVIDGGTGLLFKGSGFYLTDYKKSGSGSAGSEPKPSSSDSSTSSSKDLSPEKP